MSVQTPKATAFRNGQYKTIVYEEKNGIQTVDICEIDTGKLLARKQRERLTSGADGSWEWVYGSPLEDKQEIESIAVSQGKNPIFMRLDNATHWQWRVRQIPYPSNFYSVNVDEEKNQIVIRTTNKKYFKRINAPNNEKFEQSKIEWNWSFSTLVIQHPKPPRVVAQEKEEQKWRLSLPFQEDTEPDCKAQ